MQDRFIRRAQAERVVDGDTLDLVIDLGFDLTYKARIRLFGVDTSELRSSDPSERAKAQEAKIFVSNWLLDAWHMAEDQDWAIVLRTIRDTRGKYGRLLGRIENGSGDELNRDLLDAGLARLYFP